MNMLKLKCEYDKLIYKLMKHRLGGFTHLRVNQWRKMGHTCYRKKERHNREQKERQV